ncbi:MAG: 1-deoxy-D-xylulose-5-phosphate synthase [Ruminococcus sp.]|nr:1-deoxy-D-xylulose-5-phosphate synthase [Ruminococcus sp.]
MSDYKYKLSRLDLPKGLKKLSISECNELCSEIREILINTVSKTGGHLASNLGTVELTMAIHRVFDSPKDKIVFDVGHQAYTHKLLTGRLDRFDTLRTSGGLSGFCRPDESVHDAFISGHSSIAVSAALGIACAMKANGDKHHAIAVVGDGAATGGAFFEGLNNAGKSDTNIIVIMNYNEMSISKNVGAVAKYLSQLRTKDSYHKTKSVVERALDKTPLVGSPIKKTIRSSKNAFKDILLHSTMFEDFGFEFIGPIDGHNLEELEAGLKAAKSLGRPVFVHVNTVKGKGYPPAEQNPGEYHGVGSFEIKTGNPDVVSSDSFSSVFGLELTEMARKNNKITAITAAMKYATGLHYFAKQFPDRFYDVGIAEQHAVTFAGGLASMGLVPVFAVYSTFMQRCFDQIAHDLAIMGYHVVFGIDRAGLVGDDGETHQGIFDISILTSLPNTTIYSPSCYKELKLCLHKAVDEEKGIVAVRYPRGSQKYEFDNISDNYHYTENGSDILLVSYGRVSDNVYRATSILKNKDLRCDVLKLVRIYPVSDEIAKILSKYKKVIFFEESYKNGSIGEKYMSLCANIELVAFDKFIRAAHVDELLDENGLSPEKIAKKAEEFINET